MAFLWLTVWSMVGIFLHELAHHLFGRRSEFSLSRNYPLEPVTAANRQRAVVGALAGPAANLFLGWAGYLLGLRWFAVANLAVLLFATVVNLIVDFATGKLDQRGNDLQAAGSLMGWEVLLLPAVFIGLALYPFARLMAGGGAWGWVPAIVSAPCGGLILMGLDRLLGMRFRIVHG